MGRQKDNCLAQLRQLQSLGAEMTPDFIVSYMLSQQGKTKFANAGEIKVETCAACKAIIESTIIQGFLRRDQSGAEEFVQMGPVVHEACGKPPWGTIRISPAQMIEHFKRASDEMDDEEQGKGDGKEPV